jgi:hypothetical protein
MVEVEVEVMVFDSVFGGYVRDIYGGKYLKLFGWLVGFLFGNDFSRNLL